MRNRIDAYFSLVIRNVRDTVPKVVGYFLVRSVMDKMQLHLYEFINQNEAVLNLVSEPSHISTEREALRKQLATLRKAEKILKHDPQMASHAEAFEEEIKQQEIALTKKEDDDKKKQQEDTKKKVDDFKMEELASVPKKDPSPAAAQFSTGLPSKPIDKQQFATTSLFGDGAEVKRPPMKLASKGGALF
jgi:hypothetical protein